MTESAKNVTESAKTVLIKATKSQRGRSTCIENPYLSILRCHQPKSCGGRAGTSPKSAPMLPKVPANVAVPGTRILDPRYTFIERARAASFLKNRPGLIHVVWVLFRHDTRTRPVQLAYMVFNRDQSAMDGQFICVLYMISFLFHRILP